MKPCTCQFADAVIVVALALDADRVWFYDGRACFALGGGWHLAISPDDAGRIRLEACFNGRPADTLWSPCQDIARLRDLAIEAREGVLALA